ncbi:ABC transporter permease [bacterium]|nr:ABC transporter permease [bacterium]
MSLYDLFQTIYGNFNQSRGRFILTLSGITLGVSLLVLVGCFLESADVSFTQTHQEAIEANLITVVHDLVPTKDMKRTSKPLEQYDASAVERSPHFHNALIGYERRMITTAFYQGKSKNVSFNGISFDAPRLYSLKLQAGRFFSAEDFAQNRRVCIIGNEVWRDLGGETKSLLHEVITVQQTPFRIVGILKPKLYMGKTSDLTLWDRRIVIPVSSFRAHIRPSTAIDILFVRVQADQHLSSTMGFLKTTLERLMLTRHYHVANFRLLNPDEGDDEMGNLMGTVIRILFVGIASLALLVGRNQYHEHHAHHSHGKNT